MNKKTVLIMNIITPYNIPVYNYTASELKNFEIYFLTVSESNRQWQILEGIKFKYKIFSGLHWYISKMDWGIHLNFGILFSLIKDRPDVVIVGGYDAIAYWLGLLYCKIFKKKFVLWSGTTLLSSRAKKGMIGFLKKLFIKSTDAYLSYGTKAKEYLEYFGADSKKIINGYNTVDIDYFRQEVSKWRRGKEYKGIREKYPKHLFLFVGQLIPRKGVIKVLEALKELKNKNIGLLIIGSGPERDRLKSYCQTNNLKNVFFEGDKQKKELIKYYALADILILPSLREVWGLVVNEALASGLFVLSSKYAGVTYDLVKEGENGFVIDPYDVENLKNRIKQSLKVRLDREAIIKTVEKFSPEEYGENLLKAIKLALNK